MRDLLGAHVQQRGSFVNSERLRFDFTQMEALEPAQIAAIEEAVNMIEFGDFETIELRNVIKNNPELFTFVPISRGKEVRLTISKYSEYLLHYIL